MAEGLARHLLAKLKGVQVQELESAGVRVRSAGTSTPGGSPASEGAVQAMSRLGIDIGDHHSSELTEALIQDADVIYTMTEGHRQAVLMISPRAKGKTRRLVEGQDIIDPIGSPLEMYIQTAEMIEQGLRRRIAERYGNSAGS